MQDHHRLQVYQVARNLVLQVYAVASELPVSERYELGRQLRRAAVSVGSNIAEGSGRTTRRDLCSFLGMALGSTRELEFQLDLCERMEMATGESVRQALETTKRVQQMLTRLILRIRATDRASPER